MPGLVEQLRQVLTHWQMEHRLPFTYDGFEYKVSALTGCWSETDSLCIILDT